MIKPHKIHDILVRFHDIVDFLAPKIWQNGSKMTQKITVFGKIKKGTRCKIATFSKYLFCFSIHTHVIEAGATFDLRVNIGTLFSDIFEISK